MSVETGYIVRYECSHCEINWFEIWSCAYDDECPGCGRSVQASDYELDGTRTQEELDTYNGVNHAS
jgi:hypothetical protein